MFRHLSDTRTDEGRVRVLIDGASVLLRAETHAWQHDSAHATLEDAALTLALLPEIPQALYEQSLADIERYAHTD
ncbi:hypothetical protein [Deinococcus maricopensis]|uniref:Uncharacterized protein n=1 Tax=Deinococcus maricopensis (strain DSM 21211 / LMG 22137 / NRRL B-23946 / LB-34) TaxID=709986 RepID=E8U6V6_DEIML|nr:hypothetical protein [Deinococcus maricopensis]ADV66795.1 hypothetical protein Deima_1143 [Deinococcus maricopensis DSM 21211]